MRIDSQPNLSLVAQLTLAQAGPSGVTFQQTLTNSSAFGQGSLPSFNSAQNAGENSAIPVATQIPVPTQIPVAAQTQVAPQIPVATQQETVQPLSTESDTNAPTSLAAQNLQHTIALPQRVERDQEQATYAPSAKVADESAVTTSSVPADPIALSPAEEEPTPTQPTPIQVATDESAQAVAADTAIEVPMQFPGVAQAPEELPVLPGGPLATAASVTIESAGPARSEAPAEAGNANDPSATVPSGAASNVGGDVARSVASVFNQSQMDAGTGGQRTGEPMSAPIAATPARPTATTEASAQTSKADTVSQGSDANAGAAAASSIVNQDPIVPASPQSATVLSAPDSSDNAAQSAKEIPNPVQKVSQTELWVGMHSSKLSSSVWSPAAFTSTSRGVEAAATTSTPAQPLAVRTTVSRKTSVPSSTGAIQTPSRFTRSGVPDSTADATSSSAAVLSGTANAVADTAAQSISPGLDGSPKNAQNGALSVDDPHLEPAQILSRAAQAPTTMPLVEQAARMQPASHPDAGTAATVAQRLQASALHRNYSTSSTSNGGNAAVRSDTAVQPANVISDPTQTIDQTESWVGSLSSKLIGRVWSPASFTNSNAGTEIVANTSTPAQLLAARTTLSPAASPAASTKKGSVRTDRANSWQLSAQPAPVSGEVVASMAIPIPVAVPQIAPVAATARDSYNSPNAGAATTSMSAETSASPLPSQAQTALGTDPDLPPATNAVPTTDVATTSNGAAAGADTVGANGAGISLQALGFTPRTAGNDVNLPAGAVSAAMPNYDIASRLASQQSADRASNADASSTRFPSPMNAKIDSAPSDALPIIGRNSSTPAHASGQPASENSGQPAQPFQTSLPQASTTVSQSQSGDAVAQPPARGQAQQPTAETANRGPGTTTGFATRVTTDQPSRTGAIEQATATEGSNTPALSDTSGNTGNMFAQAVTASNGVHFPRPVAPLDAAPVSQPDDDPTTQTQTAPAQVRMHSTPTIPVPPNIPTHTAFESNVDAAASSSSNDKPRQALSVPMQSASDLGNDNAPMRIVSDNSSIAASPNTPTDSAPQPGADAIVSSFGDGNAIAATGNPAAKPIDQMSETELWVGMHSPEFGNRSIRDSAQAVLPRQIAAIAPAVPSPISATLKLPTAGLAAQSGNGSDLVAGPKPPARASAKPVVPQLSTANGDRAATPHTNAAAPAVSGTTANDSVAIGTQGVSHTSVKPQGATVPSATTNASTPGDTAAAPVAANGPDGTPLTTLGATPQISSETVNLPVVPPSSTDAANSAGVNQSSRKDAPKEAAGVSAPKVSNQGNATDAGTSKSAQTGGRSNALSSPGSSSPGSQNGGQSAQHTASDGTSTAAVISKSPDGAAAGAQTVPMHPAAHGATATASPNDNKATASPNDRGADTTASLVDGEGGAARSSLNTSKLLQTMSESEMRLGMHSSEFGTISIRTTVSPQQMLAQISLDHSDLSQAISAHAATVQTKLGNDSGLRTLIEVNQQAASSSGNSGSSQQREQQAFVRSIRAESTAVPLELDVGAIPAALANAGNGYRLDIRA